MPFSVSMKQLLEAGVHFGHRTTKWNPKMKPYIFTARNGIHILDLQQTIVDLNQYYNMIRDIAASGGTVLFVGTKRQAQEAVQREAERCGMPYVNKRWLGGTLTNWVTIRKRIDTLKTKTRKRGEGEYDILGKRERLKIDREIEKMELRLGGITVMKKLPDLIIVVDTNREATAVKEANTINIPVMALADTNSNPDTIDYILPANDDAVRSVKLILETFANAVIEGNEMRGKSASEAEETSAYGTPADNQEGTDEDLLGASTLAKLKSNKRVTDEE
ncbi:MAG: 30S ribosomal protein S2 [Pleurocapsa minor GSE-CHR-MK-17-07R]|jgi:small subunit ribosomal protein S2|nr:30S ribosomal protein S2 [Pleurocapsa minor GSE-CHR-MK 17-07R]